jgi:hypothetical protein
MAKNTENTGASDDLETPTPDEVATEASAEVTAAPLARQGYDQNTGAFHF